MSLFWRQILQGTFHNSVATVNDQKYKDLILNGKCNLSMCFQSQKVQLDSWKCFRMAKEEHEGRILHVKFCKLSDFLAETLVFSTSMMIVEHLRIYT